MSQEEYVYGLPDKAYVCLKCVYYSKIEWPWPRGYPLPSVRACIRVNCVFSGRSNFTEVAF